VAAISKAWVAIADAAVDPDSPLDATLMTGIRDDLVHLREWLGASFFAGAVQDHNHDGSNSALIQIGPNLVRNGSFEDEGAGWTITDYSGGSHAFSTSTRYHAAKSLAFTSTVLANGGGDALSDQFIAVGGSSLLEWAAIISGSVANVSSRLEAIWYDAAQAQISTSTLFSLAATPTGQTDKRGYVGAPSTARYVKLKATGGVPGVGSATGTIFFDGMFLGAPGGLVPIETQVASGSAQIDFVNGIDGSYDEYVVVLTNVVPATNSATLRLRVSEDGGSTFKAGASDYSFSINGSTAAVTASLFGSTAIDFLSIAPSGISNTAGHGGWCGEVRFFAPASAAVNKRFVWFGGGMIAAGGGEHNHQGIGRYLLTTNAINGIRFLMNSGNIASGTFTLYGVRKA